MKPYAYYRARNRVRINRRSRDAYRSTRTTIRQHRCSRCDALGHNVRTCTAPKDVAE